LADARCNEARGEDAKKGVFHITFEREDLNIRDLPPTFRMEPRLRQAPQLR
jgi:hypothetical protein